MCIVAVAWQCFTQQTHDLPLVLLSNRDEFFARPTQPLHVWQSTELAGKILAGKDQKSGGTWLGINPKTGKWAVVLNVREVGQPEPVQKISRGKLVSEFLAGDESPRQFAKYIDLTRYEGFNLVLGNREQAFILSNRGQALQSLPAGLHVFSNGQMTGKESHWAKCDKLRGRVRQEVLPLVQESLCQDASESANSPSPHSSEPAELADWQKAAFDCLRDNTKASVDNLPDTGLPASFEQPLSSVFIERLDFQDGYGTRVSSVLALSNAGYDFITQEYMDNGVISDVIRLQRSG